MSKIDSISELQIYVLAKVAKRCFSNLFAILLNYLDVDNVRLLWLRYPSVRKTNILDAKHISSFELDRACFWTICTRDAKALDWLQRNQPAFCSKFSFFADVMGLKLTSGVILHSVESKSSETKSDLRAKLTRADRLVFGRAAISLGNPNALSRIFSVEEIHHGEFPSVNYALPLGLDYAVDYAIACLSMLNTDSFPPIDGQKRFLDNFYSVGKAIHTPNEFLAIAEKISNAQIDPILVLPHILTKYVKGTRNVSLKRCDFYLLGLVETFARHHYIGLSEVSNAVIARMKDRFPPNGTSAGRKHLARAWEIKKNRLPIGLRVETKDFIASPEEKSGFGSFGANFGPVNWEGFFEAGAGFFGNFGGFGNQDVADAAAEAPTEAPAEVPVGAPVPVVVEAPAIKNTDDRKIQGARGRPVLERVDWLGRHGQSPVATGENAIREAVISLCSPEDNKIDHKLIASVFFGAPPEFSRKENIDYLQRRLAMVNQTFVQFSQERGGSRGDEDRQEEKKRFDARFREVLAYSITRAVDCKQWDTVAWFALNRVGLPSENAMKKMVRNVVKSRPSILTDLVKTKLKNGESKEEISPILAFACSHVMNKGILTAVLSLVKAIKLLQVRLVLPFKNNQGRLWRAWNNYDPFAVLLHMYSRIGSDSFSNFFRCPARIAGAKVVEYEDPRYRPVFLALRSFMTPDELRKLFEALRACGCSAKAQLWPPRPLELIFCDEESFGLRNESERARRPRRSRGRAPALRGEAPQRLKVFANEDTDERSQDERRARKEVRARRRRRNRRRSGRAWPRAQSYESF